MSFGAKLVRSPAVAAILAVPTLLPLARCQIPPSGIPTAADMRGLTPSSTVTMTQVFLAASGAGGGTLAFRGRSR